MKWMKYRFFIIGLAFRILVLNIVGTYEGYSRITQTIPTIIIEFAMMSIVLICNILFILDFLYYYLKMENSICTRITFKKYRVLLIKRVVLASIVITIMEIVIALVFGNLLSMYTILNIIIMVLLFVIAIFYWRNIHENSFAICLYIVSLIIRQVIMMIVF